PTTPKTAAESTCDNPTPANSASPPQPATPTPPPPNPYPPHNGPKNTTTPTQPNPTNHPHHPNHPSHQTPTPTGATAYSDRVTPFECPGTGGTALKGLP